MFSVLVPLFFVMMWIIVLIMMRAGGRKVVLFFIVLIPACLVLYGIGWCFYSVIFSSFHDVTNAAWYIISRLIIVLGFLIMLWCGIYFGTGHTAKAILTLSGYKSYWDQK